MSQGDYIKIKEKICNLLNTKLQKNVKECIEKKVSLSINLNDLSIDELKPQDLQQENTNYIETSIPLNILINLNQNTRNIFDMEQIVSKLSTIPVFCSR